MIKSNTNQKEIAEMKNYPLILVFTFNVVFFIKNINFKGDLIDWFSCLKQNFAFLRRYDKTVVLKNRPGVRNKFKEFKIPLNLDKFVKQLFLKLSSLVKLFLQKSTNFINEYNENEYILHRKKIIEENLYKLINFLFTYEDDLIQLSIIEHNNWKQQQKNASIQQNNSEAKSTKHKESQMFLKLEYQWENFLSHISNQKKSHLENNIQIMTISEVNEKNDDDLIRQNQNSEFSIFYDEMSKLYRQDLYRQSVQQQIQSKMASHSQNPDNNRFDVTRNLSNVKIQYIRQCDLKYWNWIGKLQIPLTKISTYTIRQTKTYKMYVTIGICTKAIFGNQNSFRSNDSICLKSWSGCVWQSGMSNLGKKNVNDGEYIEMIVDTIDWRVRWKINNQEIAKTDIPENMQYKPLYLNIMMYGKGDIMQIIDYF